MEEQLESWLRDLGDWLIVSTGDEQHEAIGVISPYQPGEYSHPLACTEGIVEDAGDQVLFLTRYPIQASAVDRVARGEDRYAAYACTRLAARVYKARLQKEE